MCYILHPLLTKPQERLPTFTKQNFYLYLVGGFSPTHLKNMRKSKWESSPFNGENKKCWKPPPRYNFEFVKSKICKNMGWFEVRQVIDVVYFWDSQAKKTVVYTTLAPTQSYFSGAKSLNNIGPDVWWYPLLLSCFSGLEISNAKKTAFWICKSPQTRHKHGIFKSQPQTYVFFSAIWESHHINTHQHTSYPIHPRKSPAGRVKPTCFISQSNIS